MYKVLTKSDSLDPANVFSVTIGSAKKMTRADYHVTSPDKLISLLALMAAAPGV